MGQLDIIARLQLNAEQFSSEAGKAASSVVGTMTKAAAEIRQPFVASFAEVNKLAQTAIQLPRTSSGSLDLSAQISQLRESAAMSDQHAIALRELAAAQEAAANAGTGNVQALRLEADASSVASIAAERDAVASRERVVQLEAVQRELNQTTSATRVHVDAGKEVVANAGLQKYAMRDLGYQLQDIGTQFATGAPLMQIFAQQGGQVFSALALLADSAPGATKAISSTGDASRDAGGDMDSTAEKLTGFAEKASEGESKFAKFAGFMAGPWGAAITIGISVLGPMVGKLLESNNAMDDAVAKMKAEAEQTDVNNRAHLAFSRTLEGQIAIQRQLNAEMDAGIRTQRQVNQNKLYTSQNSLSNFERDRPGIARDAATAVATSKKAQADLDAAVRANAGEAIVALGVRAKNAQSAADAAMAKLAQLDGQITDTRRGIREAQVPLIQEDVAAKYDASAAATLRYTNALGKLNQQLAIGAGGSKAVPLYRNGSIAGKGMLTGIGEAEYRKQLETITKQRDDAIDAARDSEKKTGGRRTRHPRDTSARDAAREAREAEQAQKALDAGLAALTSRYDPLTAAANRYAEALAEIAKYAALPATSADRLTEARATLMRGAAQEEYLKTASPDLFAKESDGGWLEGQKKASEALDRDNQRRQRDAMRAAEEEMQRLGDVFSDLFSGNTHALWQNFQREGFDKISALAAEWSKKLDKGGLFGTLMEGASYGSAGGSVFSQITGGKDNALASSIGGAIGEKAGKTFEKPLKDVFGKTLGGFAGPLGGVLGGVLGNVLGGLFNNPKFGTASVSLNQYGDVTGGTGTGNNSNASIAATGLASSVASGVNALAEQLGAKITQLAPVTVGDFDGKYRVALANTTASLNYNNFNDSTLKNFGQDQQAAIEYAIKYTLSTSVINGISAASQNIIKSGTDLQVSIQKALMIEQVPKDLKAAFDPLGAAIDDLNRRFQKTVDAMKEGGATAEQLAQAQQLYNYQLDQVKSSTDAADKTLRDFKKSLMLGTDSPYSLRDQEGTAMGALKPYLDQIAAGQTIDQSKYQDAAQAFLSVERQLYGSTDKYFTALDTIQAATNQAISKIDNATPITSAVPDPFTKATADSTAKVASGVQTGNEIATDMSALLQQNNDLLRQLIANMSNGNSSGFIGASRGFTA